MNKKLVVIVASILFIAAAASASAQNVDTKIVGFESSVLFAYDVDAGDIGFGKSYGINLTLTDALVASFIFVDGDGTFLADSTSLALSYGFADKYGMNLSIGNNGTNPQIGVGMYYNVFERKVQDALVSVLKIKAGYDFAPTDGIDQGDVVMGLGLVLGM